MNRAKLRKIIKRIKKFYLDLIPVHRKVKDKIVKLKEERNGNLVFQLRFIKKGHDCKYYRVLIKDTN